MEITDTMESKSTQLETSDMDHFMVSFPAISVVLSKKD
jgi:hypothetical protein